MQVFEDRERFRIYNMAQEERSFHEQGYLHIAGVDEAGRGPLAGPVVAAACILPPKFYLPGINDSKVLTSQQRNQLFHSLTQNKEIIYSIAIIEAQVIDTINILQASLRAMKEAVEKLSQQPDYILFDGSHIPKISIPGKGIIKGDASSLCIAAASVLAKESRDAYMKEVVHAQFPMYGFDQHKGYGTRLHLQALQKWGPCSFHRKSFAPVKALI